MHLQLSWRNIWRNPKRTLIILVAVVIGAWTMILFSSLSRGMMESMLSNSLNTLTGHIQIQKPGYRDDPVVENRIDDPSKLVQVLDKNLPPGSKWTLRIEVGGVASNAHNSQGISIVGIDVEKEKGISFYGDNIAKGRLLTKKDSHGIIIGKALADSFETKLGRKIVLMTQDADNSTSSRAFKIRGIYRAELEATEKQYIFINLKAAQKMLGINHGVTTACIKVPDLELVDGVIKLINSHIPGDLILLSWAELLPLLDGYLGMFDSFMLLWYLIVFLAMAFGLVNTMLMAVLERTREFGLLKALGMKPSWIVGGVITESLILLIIGLALGNILGFATTFALSKGIDLSFMSQGSEYFGMGHVIVPLVTAKDVITANAVILLLGLIVCLYPAMKAGRITPVKAMTQN